jgi:hypothetical protein
MNSNEKYKGQKKVKIIDLNRKRCIGRTSNGDQCTRLCKKPDDILCGCHVKFCEYGTINQCPTERYFTHLSKKKTCCMEKEIPKDIHTRLDIEHNYTPMRFAVINGKEYLIDTHHNLYLLNKKEKLSIEKIGYINSNGEFATD